jgi:hypothetical protein
VVVEPIVDIVGVVRRLVVADDVALAGRVADGHNVEQLDERFAPSSLCEESERPASSDVEPAHQSDRAVADVLEFAFDRRAGLHRYVGIASFEGPHPGLLVETNDVLVSWALVVDPEDLVALVAELLVLRVQPHLLPVRLQACAGQKSRRVAAPVPHLSRANASSTRW